MLNPATLAAPAAASAAATAAPVAPASAGQPRAFARELERASRDGADAPAADTAPGGAREARSKGRASGERRGAERHPARAPANGDEPLAPTPDAPAPAAAPAADPVPPADLPALLAGLLAHAAHAPAAAPADAHAAVATGRHAGTVTNAAPGRGAEPAPLGNDGPPGLRAKADAEATLPALRPETPAFVLPPSLLAPAGAAAMPAGPAAASAPPPPAQISAALGTPGFAPGLSAQVSLMVRDGIQEARLQLNPAEMGPITVQIQIDGNQAQVNLSAEQAPTRQALEQALPTLASALRDGGLTLTGGGVFEQPRPRHGEAASSAGGGGRGDGGTTPAPAAAAGSPVRTRGVVDLYA